MPTLRQIFGNAVTDSDGKTIIVRDRKRWDCSHIDLIDDAPFIRRCINRKMLGSTVCKDHAFTVTYLGDDNKLHTAYFDTIEAAERCRKKTSWREVNYTIPGVFSHA
jgi:hypothetical protein